MKKRIDWKVISWSFAAVAATAVLGSLWTDIGPWYESIKPSITPPSFVFPIVWTALYFMIFFAMYLSISKSRKKTLISCIFGINLAMNALWTLFYFKMRNPALAFIDIIVMLATIAYLILLSCKIDKKAAYLLIPYLLWVLFAAVLNYLSI